MSTLLWIAVLFLVSLVSQSSCGSVFIGTGRGAIRAVKIGNSYTLREVAMWEYEDGMEWTLETDPRFPNGVFIHSVTYPGLVWDTQAFQFTPGTNVNLYTKKNTLADTKNQRWLLSSANQYGVIYNTNMVANVTQGKVVLANKANSAFQKFYPLSTDSEEMWSVTVENYMGGDVSVLVQSRVGNYTVQVSGSHIPDGLMVFPGTVLTFDISPPYTRTLTGSTWITLPPTPTLPVNTPTTWTGTLQDSDTIPIEFILTFTSGGFFSGTGSDERYGSFTADGSTDSGLYMNVQYEDDSRSFSFEGVLVDDDGFRMSGTTRRWDAGCECTTYGQLYINMQ